MHKIGVMFGMEDTFPWALIDRINKLGGDSVHADVIKFDAVRMADPTGYRLIVDRISHDIAFYRDETARSLIGDRSGTTYRLGQGVRVALAEADQTTGTLRFDLVDEAEAAAPRRQKGRRR